MWGTFKKRNYDMFLKPASLTSCDFILFSKTWCNLVCKFLYTAENYSYCAGAQYRNALSCIHSFIWISIWCYDMNASNHRPSEGLCSNTVIDKFKQPPYEHSLHTLTWTQANSQALMGWERFFSFSNFSPHFSYSEWTLCLFRKTLFMPLSETYYSWVLLCSCIP